MGKDEEFRVQGLGSRVGIRVPGSGGSNSGIKVPTPDLREVLAPPLKVMGRKNEPKILLSQRFLLDFL